jgi:hypothetical protein
LYPLVLRKPINNSGSIHYPTYYNHPGKSSG